MVSKLDDFVNKTFLSLHKIWLELANPRTRVQGSRGSARRARRGEGVRVGQRCGTGMIVASPILTATVAHTTR